MNLIDSTTGAEKMQGIKINAQLIPEQQMRRLCDGAYGLLVQLQSTEEGRKMLREEIKAMRREKAERSASKC